MNLDELWDFGNPELSEQNLRTALRSATGDEALILQTQIARTYGLRQDFTQAQEILAAIEPQVSAAGLETRVHYYLELGRTYSSATHSPESQTNTAKEKARSAYMLACELAQEGALDNLAIDALHMMAFVDTEPEKQLEWNLKAAALIQSSSQQAAKKWEGSIRNNTGYALYELGRYEDALAEFELALAVRENEGDLVKIRIAYWMIAWTLRALGRLAEALEIQLRLESEWDRAGEPDPYVFEELELLYRALNDEERASYYSSRRQAPG